MAALGPRRPPVYSAGSAGSRERARASRPLSCTVRVLYFFSGTNKVTRKLLRAPRRKPRERKFPHLSHGGVEFSLERKERKDRVAGADRPGKVLREGKE